MFSSNLSVSEFVLAEQEQAFPIRQVMGSSVYKIGYQMGGIQLPTGEIKGLMRPLRDVYLHAIFRMQREAQQLGAHAVIGVRLEEKRRDASIWTPKNVIEVKATGTAVALDREDVPEKPALSGLSGRNSTRCGAPAVPPPAWFSARVSTIKFRRGLRCLLFRLVSVR